MYDFDLTFQSTICSYLRYNISSFPCDIACSQLLLSLKNSDGALDKFVVFQVFVCFYFVWHNQSKER